MNNFIIGQITPDLLQHLRWGTYILFGMLSFGGAAFIYFFFPETKGLSLEEMDVLFGSAGVAAADTERMREIAREIGLDDVVKGDSVSAPGTHEPKVLDEKVGTQTREHGSESD
jgi:hypothetical protein